MVFSSLVFLCAFLPLVLLLYTVCPLKYRNHLLVVTSLVFYGWGEPRHICIMIFTIAFNYVCGMAIDYFNHADKQKRKKVILVLSLVGNLGILIFFKYANMLITSWNRLTASELGLLNLALPIGISFYIFQTMSYTIDVYRGIVGAQRSLVSFGMYISMFPQLIAGPIVRYQWIEPQLAGRIVTEERWVKGMQRFLIGLGKKVIFANQIGSLWNDISGGSLTALSTLGAWIGAIAYTFQIYFDFSGYSDMAIGLGQMFGFSLPENFRHPYEAKNITEFWRRWHITLGTWFREYVYIPLGGNRKGVQRQAGNLFVVWLLTGLWHGASWNFAVWGLYFFVLLFAEKVFLLKEMERWPMILRHIYGKFFIIVGWVIFALSDFGDMWQYLQVMFGIRNSLVNQTALYQLRTCGFFLVVLAVASTRIPSRLIHKIQKYMIQANRDFAAKRGKAVEFAVLGIYTFMILLISMGMIVRGSYNPFLYFRF